MTETAPDLVETPDWAFAYAAGGSGKSFFHALYRCDQLGNPSRGLTAILTQGSGDSARARQTAAMAAHGFAEAYFGVSATLSGVRAAGQALESINAWLHAQPSTTQSRAGMQATFGAILFTGKRLGFVTIGAPDIFRWRAGHLLKLTEERTADDGRGTLLGAGRDVRAQYYESDAQPGDRYLLLMGDAGRDLIESALTAGDVAPVTAESYDRAALMIDLHRLPDTGLNDISAAFEALPLAEPPQEGDTLDGFVIGRTLYRSRYTLLRRARDTVAGRDVLLKFPLPAMFQDRIFQAGFIREAWIGCHVRSPWIADYLPMPPGWQSCLYIVLPYYRGQTLEQRLKAKPPISFAEGLSIALRLCAAVTDLDRLQIIHRDLKPENIILPDEGGLRLLDLGMAYLPGLDDPEEERLGGTTRYMAPELFRGAPPDARSEVFALGVTIYRLFSGGDFPFGRMETQPLARKRPDLPGWLGRCLAQAIAFDPALRFANAAAFAEALETGLRTGEASPALHGRWRLRLDDARIWQGVSALLAVGLGLTLTHLLKR